MTVIVCIYGYGHGGSRDKLLGNDQWWSGEDCTFGLTAGVGCITSATNKV